MAGPAVIISLCVNSKSYRNMTVERKAGSWSGFPSVGSVNADSQAQTSEPRVHRSSLGPKCIVLSPQVRVVHVSQKPDLGKQP